MFLYSLLILFLFTSLFLSVQSTISCPPSEQVRPCRCDIHGNKGTSGGYRSISCYGISSKQLKETITRLAEQNHNFNRHFFILQLTNLTSDTIEEGVLNGLTFNQIRLWRNKQLKKIDVKASADPLTVTSLSIKDCPNLTTNERASDFFTWIHSMKSLKHIEMFETDLATINKLNLSNITYFQITLNKQPLSIESDSFYGCPQLETLNLINNRINLIGPKSLRLQNSSKSIHIMLSENGLTSTSFAVDSLANFNRPVKLSLWKNEIRVIDEAVFRPFLAASKQNAARMYKNPIDCSDCKNYWIVIGQAEFQSQLTSLNCDGQLSKPFFKHDWSKCQK